MSGDSFRRGGVRARRAAAPRRCGSRRARRRRPRAAAGRASTRAAGRAVGTRTSPASRSTRRCRETAGREIVNAAASSPAVRSRSASSRRTLRRVGSRSRRTSCLPLLLCNRSVTQGQGRAGRPTLGGARGRHRPPRRRHARCARRRAGRGVGAAPARQRRRSGRRRSRARGGRAGRQEPPPALRGRGRRPQPPRHDAVAGASCRAGSPPQGGRGSCCAARARGAALERPVLRLATAPGSGSAPTCSRTDRAAAVAAE